MGLVSIYAHELDADLDDGILDVIDESQLGALQALMPHGPAWPVDLGLKLVEFERALSYEFSRVKRRVGNLIDEIFPDTIYEMLADQERVWGLPDKCSQPTTIAGRRVALRGKMVGFGDPNISDIKTLALSVGYLISILTPIRTADLFSCDSGCDDSLYGYPWMYWWEFVTMSGANDAEVNCILESYTPDHTVRTSRFLSWSSTGTAENNSWFSVCWSPYRAIFCAISLAGTHRVMTSPDGVTWTARTAAEANQWISVCWSPALALFCAVATSGTHQVMTSPDGITWTPQTSSGSTSWESVCWSPELGVFCAVGVNGSPSTNNIVMTSSDGVTWTLQTVSTDHNTWVSVCWSSELYLFCAVSQDGTHRVLTSPDGINWTGRTAAEANTWKSVCWSPDLGVFCAVARDGTHRVMTSPDGIVWTSQTAAEANQWQSITAITGLSEFIGFIALAESGTHRIMTSIDGITWTTVTAPGGAVVWLGSCWSEDLLAFVGVGVGFDALLLS